MRYLFIITLALGLAGCSQSSKTSEKVKSEAKKAITKAKAKSTAPAKSSVEGTVKCAGFGVKREIVIVKGADSCKVQYTKDGVMTEIADGSAASDHCQNVASKVQSNLESNGFKCQ